MAKHVLNCHSLKIMIILSLFSIIIINNYFSAKLTAKMNVKSKVDKINSLDDLFDSHINLIFVDSKSRIINNNKLYNKLRKRSQNSYTIIRPDQLIKNEKWLEGVVKGENAIFFYEPPIKNLLLNFLKKSKSDINFKFLDNLGYSLFSIASNRRLNNEFRHNLNFRYNLLLF